MKDERIPYLVDVLEMYGWSRDEEFAEEMLGWVDEAMRAMRDDTKPLTSEEIEKRLQATRNEISEL